MKSFCAVLFFALALPSVAMAQGVPRIKAVLVSFDGKLLTVKTGDPEPMRIGLLSDTRIIKQEKRALADIKAGDFVGATFITGKDGMRRAQEVHIFPESLRGSGEGLYPMDSGHSMIGGTVSDMAPNLLVLNYRGSSDASAPSCTGRAPRTGGCEGRADMMVATGVPVTALLQGDPGLLVPGAVLAISVVAGPNGYPVTPGLTIEGMTIEGLAVEGKAAAGKAPAAKTPVAPPRSSPH